ncbi:MAG: SUMF1/EgtB/PvdO family nonheme iron enzyme [Candidatus Pacearchaeota archaeon]
MPIKSLKPNQYGVYDMLGNAAEFVNINLRRLKKDFFLNYEEMREDRSFIEIDGDPCFICITPGINFTPGEDESIEKMKNYFPNHYDNGYSPSKNLFGDNVGFRIIRRLEKEEK